MPVPHAIGAAVSQGLCRCVAETGWEWVHHPGIGGDVLRTHSFDNPLVLLCSPETGGLQFLGHEWSGAVSITVDGVRQTVSLARDGGPEAFVIGLPPQDRNFHVTIESVAVAGRDHARCEVWLTGLVFNSTPLALGRSVMLNDRARLIHGDWGDFLALNSDGLLPDAIAQTGSWAPDDIAIFRQHIREGDTVLDVGSNIGHHTVVFSKLVGPGGLVAAIEAQRLMYQLVNANCLLNRCRNVVPLHLAAGSEHGIVTMYPIDYDGEANFGALGVDTTSQFTDNPGEEVEVHPLDDVLPAHLKDRRVAFVKIDVQAYELFVLRGMRRIIEESRPTVFVEISPYWMRKAGYEFTEVYDLLRAHGYDLIHRDYVKLGPDGVPEISPDQDVEWDLLAVHPGRRD